MACEVCEHCQERLSSGNSVIRNGCSYHDKCHKCYVCSETNLRDAEVFKGVIFCSSCSKRIFQGCSTARHSKDSNKSKLARQPRPRRYGTQSRMRRDSFRGADTRVLELAAASTYRSDESTDIPIHKKKNKLSTLSHVGTEIDDDTLKKMKKDSLEIGMTTDVTQELLKEFHCPVVEKKNNGEDYRITKSKHHKSKAETNQSKKRKRREAADMRMIELGASTEIATMTLRKQSDQPVRANCKSQSHFEQNDSWNTTSTSMGTIKSSDDLMMDSDKTIKTNEQDNEIRNLSFGNLIRIPLIFFKRHILERSSLVSVLMSSSKSSKSFFSRVKSFFYNEIYSHHRDGIRKLYSTINLRKTPYKLGWLHISSTGMRKNSRRRCHHQMGRCKHYRNSHSYRCLRAHVMKHAGPTKSELATFRANLARSLAPRFLQNLLKTASNTHNNVSCLWSR